MNNMCRMVLCCSILLIAGCNDNIAYVKKHCTAIGQLPKVKPDYAGIAIPPNIAPMNFMVLDSSSACFAEFASVNGKPFVVHGRKKTISIAAPAWKKLLSDNKGNPLRITIFTKDQKGRWFRYQDIVNTIAAEQVDRYCTYRLLNFQYSYWRELRIAERDLTSFAERTLVNTENYTQNFNANDSNSESQNAGFKCVNCHTPMNNDPQHFILQLRSTAYGSETLIASGDSITLLSSRLGHASWHPGGKYIAFSVYKVQQYFHAVGRQFIDVYDNNSFIVMYDVINRKVIAVPELSKKEVLATWPAWTPDGKFLYFCSTDVPWSDYKKEPPDNFNKTKYSLMRIAYNAENNSWGSVDTILSAQVTGLSISLPRISPDNRFCVFTMQNHGPYPYIDASSDLYIMEIATKNYRKLPVNSEYNESWHSWSKNGKWMIFSSRRGGGIFTRLHLCHIDSAGNAGKPFVVPQRDPAFYDSFVKCFNVPEFAIEKVRFTERQLFSAVNSRKRVSVPMPKNTAVQIADTTKNGWSSVESRE